ncbi:MULTISPECIES: ImmA/IrrE family metallo-endopeptidase [Streptomyces]|nr:MULTISPECIES: ImmA/IrrE family metallo-endopeptidase [Streptomyces]QDA07246.1 ImmA/IrrE family metallo-endopeptidase [Streptomyces rimosus]QEV78527.1 ImmA/IrrE family metallo-endopeptidase [Streptomyces rimosus]
MCPRRTVSRPTGRMRPERAFRRTMRIGSLRRWVATPDRRTTVSGCPTSTNAPLPMARSPIGWSVLPWKPPTCPGSKYFPFVSFHCFHISGTQDAQLARFPRSDSALGGRMPVARIHVTTQAGRLYDPASVLDSLGIPVVYTWLRDTWGAWSADHGRVVVATGLSPVQERCVLAHEVEHVLAGDTGCMDRDQLTALRQERRADLKAARKLIAISDLCQVAQWAPDLPTVAAELGVTERLVEVRLNDLKGEGWPAWQAGSKIAG